MPLIMQYAKEFCLILFGEYIINEQKGQQRQIDKIEQDDLEGCHYLCYAKQ